MKTPAASFVRLLGALEDLAAQEDMLLATEDYAAVVRTQERAAPLVDELARLGAAAITSDLRPRLQALLERRERSQVRLAAQIAQTRDALLRTQSKQRRISQVAPAYGNHGARRELRQLSAVI